MKCELAQEYAALSVYGELSDDQAHQLQQHLGGCEECSRELEALQALQKAMSLLTVAEPSPNLLARTRIRLEEALDAMPHGSWLLRVWQRFQQALARLSAVPVMASALLLFGTAVGIYAGYCAGVHVHDSEEARLILSAPPQSSDTPGLIASVSGIVQQPDSEQVEVHYNRLVPETIHGSLDDPQIRRLLLVGTQNRVNPDVRGDSVSLLADECRAGHQCSGGPIRNALMLALRTDRNAVVRLKALNGLQPYIADDMQVRDAILESLLNDSDPRIRTQAITLIEPVEGDSSVRQVLHAVSLEDDNPQIRIVSRQVLDQIPQIQ
ncbi:HEAT repeat domain-containing protein [Paracidobacterium acidisoli]|uniref:Putative zinc-finger domain-containing protein n=1 Tax=Paracidobacterium acidisoli TaxID=2303751 RepID=A0A372IN76_9BACT|nr:HEAT repeat domain-containing protein [Paracidobacterium acidisoli]MBT9332083.1 HEAT repeat domain-containing protein [Paracidobacterium acidisoli]